MFGAIRQGINSSQGVIETALDHLGEGGEIFTEVEKVRRIAGNINFAAGIIGGRTGAGIRRTTSRIINTLDTATADIQSGLEQAQGDLSELDQNVSAFSETGRSPNVSQTTSEVTIASVVSGDDKPVIEAVIKLLAGKTRQYRTTMKDLARAKILGGFVARCAFIGTQYRKAITRLQGDQSPGLTDEEATAPCLAIDLEELDRQVVEGQQSAPDTGAEPTGEPAGEAAAEPTETPPSATVTLTWGEQTDLDLAVGLTRDISWDSTPDGTELGDDVVCPTSGGTEQVVVEGPGIYHISVGLWSGCIINEQHLPHFASYTIKVEYSDGRQEEYSGAIEGQIWMFVAEIELK